jgi:hypothetical protein
VGYPTADLDFNSGTTAFKDSVKGKRPSYSGGLEAGFYLGHFLIGAEAGYQSIELKSSSNSAGATAKFDLSGIYGKALIGLTFF